MTVGQVRVSILISQTEPGVTKVSFRSKPAMDRQQTAVDVNLLAQQFGGGGHKHAAGAKLKMDIDAARAKVIGAIQSRT